MSSENEITNECPICFYNIEGNDYINTECCSNKIHIRCLIEWYIINNNKTLCFICNQNNPFIQDLATHGVAFNDNSRQTIQNDNSIIDIESNSIYHNESPRRIRFLSFRKNIVFFIIPLTVSICTCIVFISCVVILFVYYL